MNKILHLQPQNGVFDIANTMLENWLTQYSNPRRLVSLRSDLGRSDYRKPDQKSVMPFEY